MAQACDDSSPNIPCKLLTSSEEPFTSSEKQRTSNQQQPTSNEEPLIPNEELLTSSEKRLTLVEQGFISNEKRLTSGEEHLTLHGKLLHLNAPAMYWRDQVVHLTRRDASGGVGRNPLLILQGGDRPYAD